MKYFIPTGALMFSLLNVVAADTNPPATGFAQLPSEQARMERSSTPPIARGIPVIERQLTPEQRAQLRDAIEANREKLNALNTQLHAARQKMFNSQLAEKFDEADFRAKSEAVGKIQTEIDVLNAQAFAKIRPSLTAEQIEKIKSPPALVRSPTP